MKTNIGMCDEPFSELIDNIRLLGNEVISPFSEQVDREARFPTESINSLKKLSLLSCYVPAQFGGMELSVKQLCKVCEVLGEYCASSAMVFAMHQIQVACIVHHRDSSTHFQTVLEELVLKQYLFASATTEMGVGGNLRKSICSLEIEGNKFNLKKNAPVISYGRNADAVMVTCRKNPSAHESDQVQVLLFKADYTLEKTSDWDTLGFRGTCSEGFILSGSGTLDQVQPEPFGDILGATMHPVSHLVWSSLWLGLAHDAVKKARSTVASAARKDPGNTPISAIRLTETDEQLYLMKSGLYQAIDEYQAKLKTGQLIAFQDFGYSIRMNNVKLRCSEMLIDIVTRSLFIVGISGYKNNSKMSLSRHIRDAYGAAIMVNNDRIRGHNATMHIGLREK